jgi:hypothetical protein
MTGIIPCKPYSCQFHLALFFAIFVLYLRSKILMCSVLLKKNPYPFLLVLFWILAIAIIDPRGEFPINDDWAYSKNVHSLVVDGAFTVDGWPAMTLVSQTIYGSLACFVFGFSFTVLRCSILLLAIVATHVLFRLLEKRGANPFLAFLLSAGFCFSQLFMALSFTFMTDVFFIAIVVFALYQLLVYLEHRKKINYIGFVFFCLMAVLNRQQGLLLPLLLVFPFLYKQKLTLRGLALVAIPFVCCLLAHSGYRYLLQVFSIPHNMWAAGKLTETVSNFDIAATHKRVGDMLVLLGWLLLPLAISFWSISKHYTWRNLGIFVPVALVVYGFSFGGLHHFPTGNVSMITAVGPEVLKDIFTNYSSRYWLSDGMRLLLAVVAYLSVATLFFKLVLFCMDAFRQKKINPLNVSLWCFAGVYFVFSVFNPAYFDRYVLPLALIVLVLLVSEKISVSRFGQFVLGLFVFALFLLAVFTEKDYLNWQRTRWTALRDLEREGITAKQIDGGFEYNAWYQPGKGFYQAPDTRSWWWVDRDDYIISNGNVEGFAVKKAYSYQHFVPYVSDTVFVLQKQVSDSLREQK